jgi:hypothetical protein
MMRSGQPVVVRIKQEEIKMSRDKVSQPDSGARCASNTRATERVVIKNVNVPRYSSRVNAAKYEAMRRALFKVLPKKAPGLTQADMFKAVLCHLPGELFPGGAKANWWAKTVQLDLEAKRLVARENTKPLRWHRT